jgi:hypothetical protein
MAADPSKITNTKKLQQLMSNAEERGETTLARMCMRRIYELGGADHADPVVKRLWQAVTAYEETLRRKHGKSQRASYTRRKIEAKGAIATLSDWALDQKVTPGFEALVSAGMAEFTGEYVVVEHAERFEPHVVLAARKRLENHGVALPKT